MCPFPIQKIIRLMTRIPWWRIEISDPEIRRVKSAIKNKKVSQGPVTAEFEQRLSGLLGVPYVAACTSGSTALLMALVAADIGNGDEVIVPNRSWIATAHAVLMAGAKVVLADDDGSNPDVFVAAVRKKINARTRCIIPVHLNGRGADMKTLAKIARQKKLLLIEDAAQAFMSKSNQKFLGCQSLAGCYSLSLAKLISTGQGGFVATRDSKIYAKLRKMRNHGVEDPVNVRYTGFGFNFRFNDVLASIGNAQLDRLAKSILHLKKIHEMYREGLESVPGVRFLEKNILQGEIPLYAEIMCQDREKIIKVLASAGVQTRPYYPNLNSAPQFLSKEKFPFSAQYGRACLFLPSGPAQPLKNVEVTISIIRRFLLKKNILRIEN